MIGLGKWACSVDSMFFSGDVALTVIDKNGEYVDNYGFVGLDCDMRLSDILDCNEQGMGEMSL